MSDITTTENKRVNLEYLATDSRKPKFRCMAWFLDYMSPISTRNSPHRAANSSTSKQLLISFHHVSPIIFVKVYSQNKMPKYCTLKRFNVQNICIKLSNWNLISADEL